MRRIVERTFVARVPLEEAWKHLADIERWPSWAIHIISVKKTPLGPISAETKGAIKLRNGARTTFEMIEFEPMKHWKWVGPFLGAKIYYDHVFERISPEETRVRFTLDASGWSAWLLGGILGRIYRKNLDRAIPLLVHEMESRILG